jgi:hypothetical protein
MNADTVFQLIRYVLIAAGGYITGKGWANEVQWEALIGFVAIILPAAWGLYVKWRTSPVEDKIIVRQDLPTVSSATGAKVAPPSHTP